MRILIYALFFLSGIAGLIYQIVWTRQLVLVFGNTMLATSTVLSAFMGGLAAGSYLLGLYIDRRPRPLIKIYALLEAGIGLFALAFPLLLAAATPLYSSLYRHLADNILLLNLIRFAVCFLLISLPTFLMGGTLPVLLKRFVESGRGIGRQTGFFYGLNTVGAVVGTLACGYYLLRALGMQKSTWIAVALNLGVALAAWLVSRRESVAGDSVAASVSDSPEASGSAPSRMVVQMVLLGIGISGFCALAYEVFWTRMLNLFLHNNIYSFTAILATFLTGIALGSLLYSRFLSRIADQVRLFIAIQLGIGVFAYATPYLFGLLHGALFNNYSEAVTLAKTAVIMIAPTILMGIAVPLAVQICQRGARREGTSVGTVYAVNTVGAILGAFAAGFILLPWIGLQRGVILVAGLNVLAGMLPMVLRARPRRRPFMLGAGAVVAILVVFLTPGDLFRGLFERSHPSADILLYKEGKVANVLVYDFHKTGYKDLHLNAVEEASSRLWHVQLFKLLGILPVMVHESPDDAVMIAFGAGMSAGACIDLVTEFEVVDLNPDIDGVAEIFRRENLDVINHPKLERVVNDGRNALLLDPRQYSLIISDATNPKMFDSWTLYSQEFYELVKQRLKPGGVFCQWVLIPLPGDAIKVILNTFRSVFPHMSFWGVYGSSQVLMLGTPERLEIDYLDLRTRLEPIFVSSGLAEFGVDSTEKFLSYFLLGEDAVDEMLAGFHKISTDDLPHAQFHIEQDDVGVEASLDLVRYQESILPYLTNLGDAPAAVAAKLSAYEDIARRLHLGFLQGRPLRFQEAAQVDRVAGLADPNVKSMLHFGPEKERYFRSRVTSHPDDANARNTLGYILWRKGEYAAASEQLEAAIALKSDFANALANLAGIHVDRGDYDAAVSTFLTVAEMNPARSVLHRTARQLNIIHLLRKLGYEGDSPDLFRALGNAYYSDGELLRAIAAFESAVAFAPEDPANLISLARIYENHEFIDAARSVYNRLADALPQEERVRAKAAKFDALARDPRAKWEWLSHRLYASGGKTKADEHPESCDQALALWNSFDFDGSVRREKLREAAALYEESIAQEPEDLHAYVDAATLYEILEEYDQAAFVWRQLAAVASGTNAEQNARRAQLLDQLQWGALAAGTEAGALAEISQSYRIVGRAEPALDYARRAVALEANRAELWANLAAALAETGQYAEAAAAAASALAIDPNLSEARSIRDALSPFLQSEADK